MELAMKKTLFILLALVFAAACHEPEYVMPTADRQGITSLTAYFTSGKYVDQEMGRLEVNDPNLDRYVIPIPWFFPESSDDITTPYMLKVRVMATLQANCKLDPPLSILDLTEENHFTYTDATGGTASGTTRTAIFQTRKRCWRNRTKQSRMWRSHRTISRI